MVRMRRIDATDTIHNSEDSVDSSLSKRDQNEVPEEFEFLYLGAGFNDDRKAAEYDDAREEDQMSGLIGLEP